MMACDQMLEWCGSVGRSERRQMTGIEQNQPGQRIRAPALQLQAHFDRQGGPKRQPAQIKTRCWKLLFKRFQQRAGKVGQYPPLQLPWNFGHHAIDRQLQFRSQRAKGFVDIAHHTADQEQRFAVSDIIELLPDIVERLKHRLRRLAAGLRRLAAVLRQL